MYLADSLNPRAPPIPEGNSLIEYSDGTFEVLGSDSTGSVPKLPGMIAFVWYLPSSFHARVRLPGGTREGMLVDCGAIDNLAGEFWVQRVQKIAERNGQGTVWKNIPVLSVEGVGSGESEISQLAICPVMIADGPLSTFTTNVVAKSELPGLLGLKSLTASQALIDVFNKRMYYIGPGGYKITLSPGSRTLKLEQAASGHLLLPCTEYGNSSSSTSSGTVAPTSF